MLSSAFGFVILIAFITGVNGQGAGFSNPGTENPIASWQVGTTHNVEWSTTDTGDIYLGVFDGSGSGFSLGGKSRLQQYLDSPGLADCLICRWQPGH